ncbi:MAG: 2Fe-2S iron-sulfur cluster-binding protein [Alcanivorax sp.]|nr:2Fe-2S iron-sulfur cluster-binding protein [Alcanivorax sp.]
MAHRIRINDRHDLICPSGVPILTAGREAGFGFPHACRNGVCERCQGRLIAGAVRQRRGASQDRLIHAGDARADRVLYCVAIPISDCEIEVPEITAPGELPVHRLQCQILRREPLNHDVTRVVLRLPAGRTVRWFAGQYLILELEHGGYPFSIANAPGGSANAPGGRELELHVRHGNDNSAAHAIMADLDEQATVAVTLPEGRRFIDRAPERPLWFICGSTGFAPVKAMIERLIQLDYPLPVRLFWGARTERDLYLPDLPARWGEQLRDFHAVTALSDISKPGHARGLVHEAALEALAEPREPLFYLGGSPAMAWAVFDALVEEGVPAENIHSDVFDYAPREG